MSCSQLQRSTSVGRYQITPRFPSPILRAVLPNSANGVTSASARGPWVAAKGKCPSLRGHRCNPTRRRNFECKAISLPENVDLTIRNVLSISAVVGISYAVLLAAVSEPPPPSSSRALPPAPAQRAGSDPRSARGVKDEDDNFVWGLMGFISCLPLFDWLAWVLAAMSDGDRAALYGIYAALYGSPLLLRGLNWQDPWVLFMLVLCAVHVQAERIAQTEPEALRSIRPVGLVGGALRGLMGGTGALLSGVGGVLAEDSRRAVRRPGGDRSGGGGGGSGDGDSSAPAQLGAGQDRLQLDQDPDLVKQRTSRELDPRRDASRDPELEDVSTRELRQFDEQLKQAERRRWGGRGGRGGGRASEGSGRGGGR